MSRRAAAEATLDGQVNDWVKVAGDHARDVVDLCTEADLAAEAYRREIESARVDVAKHVLRANAAVAAAERAQAAADRACAEVVELEAQVEAWRATAVNLNERIVERSDNAFLFAYGSRGAIEAFRKLIGV